MRSLTKKATSILRRDKKSKERTDVLYLLSIIQRRKWRKVRKILKSPTGAVICKMTDPSGLNPLGAALGCNAPLDVAEKIIELYPEAILHQDEYGSTPLHFGCLNGCQPDLIELILQHEQFGRKAGICVDLQNSGPLHHATNYACSYLSDCSSLQSSSRYTNEDGTKSLPSEWLYMNDDLYLDVIIKNSLKVISMLCRVVPEAVFQESSDGYTPLDIIQSNKLSNTNEKNFTLLENVYQELKQSGVRHYKALRKKWESEGYVTDFPHPPKCKPDILILTATCTKCENLPQPCLESECSNVPARLESNSSPPGLEYRNILKINSPPPRSIPRCKSLPTKLGGKPVDGQGQHLLRSKSD